MGNEAQRTVTKGVTGQLVCARGHIVREEWRLFVSMMHGTIFHGTIMYILVREHVRNNYRPTVPLVFQRKFLNKRRHDFYTHNNI
jgi:hypothetical protein